MPIVGDVRGAGFFWALELVRDADDTPLRRRGARAAAARLPARPAARGGPDRPARTTAATPCCTSPRRWSAARRSCRRWPTRPRPCWPTPPSASSPDDPHRARLVARGGRAGRAVPGARRRALRRRRRHRRRLRGPVDGLAAARARRRRSPCSRPTCAGTARAGATAASARRCGRSCPSWPSASGARRRWPRRRRRARRVGGDRRLVRRAGRRRLVPPRGLRAGLHDRRPGRAWSTGSLEVAPPERVQALDGARRARPLRLRRASGAACSCPTTPPCSRRGWRSACATACARPARGVRALAGAGAARRGPGEVRRRDGRRPRAGRRGGARGQRRDARLRAAARAPVGHLVAHRAHRAGAGRARGDRLDRRRVRSPTARTFLHYFRTTPRRPDRVRLGRRPARARRAAERPHRGRRRRGRRDRASTS